MGQFLEDFAVGACMHTRGRTITESDLMTFAGLTGDFTELHTNEEYARTTRFGQRIVHGALVFSISIGLTTRTNLLDDTIVAFARVDHLRFVRPVFIGDTIRVVKRVMAVEPSAIDHGTLAFHTRVLNQHDHVVVAYVDRLVVKRRVAPRKAMDHPPSVVGDVTPSPVCASANPVLPSV
jgi:acyl dehydratase